MVKKTIFSILALLICSYAFNQTLPETSEQKIKRLNIRFEKVYECGIIPGEYNYSESLQRIYEYDTNGNLVQELMYMPDRSVFLSDYKYDSLNRLVEERSGNFDSIFDVFKIEKHVFVDKNTEYIYWHEIKWMGEPYLKSVTKFDDKNREIERYEPYNENVDLCLYCETVYDSLSSKSYYYDYEGNITDCYMTKYADSTRLSWEFFVFSYAQDPPCLASYRCKKDSTVIAYEYTDSFRYPKKIYKLNRDDLVTDEELYDAADQLVFVRKTRYTGF
jgi:hypothetical protein